ncbi:hypothetical protein M569_03797, partial [Genlisea aurea]
QGVPFFHAGDEILRSKSLDRDSYNSGDWFNRLDFGYDSNNWGVGVPPKEKNEKNWPLIRARLGDPAFKPRTSHILAALDNFCTLIGIRYSSPLFRLKTASEILERVRFHNAGPGVVAMSIEDGHEGVVDGRPQLDPMYSCIVVVINASPDAAAFAAPRLCGKTLQLHPVLLQVLPLPPPSSSMYEPSTGRFGVPARTTSVFVEPR